jgi:undecaprenyl-diphosphatase
MLLLPVFYGLEAIQVSLHMAIVSMVGLGLYKWLKLSTVRVRPYRFNENILQNVAALDQFSFPSGHTLHAVSFSAVLLSYYPEWAVLVIPFAALVALSRVILGLHYPSDVLIGALLGLGLAQGSIALVSVI